MQILILVIVSYEKKGASEKWHTASLESLVTASECLSDTFSTLIRDGAIVKCMYVQRCRKSEFEVKETNKMKSILEGAYVVVIYWSRGI